MNARTTLRTLAVVTLAGFALALGAGCAVAPDGQGEDSQKQDQALAGGGYDGCYNGGTTNTSDPLMRCLYHAGCRSYMKVFTAGTHEFNEAACNADTAAVESCISEYANVDPYYAYGTGSPGCTTASFAVDFDPICPGGCTQMPGR